MSGRARIDCRNAAQVWSPPQFSGHWQPVAAWLAQRKDVAGDIAGQLQDPIVGVWVGKAAQPENDPFDVRLTFVSPKGGVSRYPSEPRAAACSSAIARATSTNIRKPITYGGSDEKTDGCLNGTMKLSVDGDTMKYDWTASYNGQDYSSTGELKRQASARALARSVRQERPYCCCCCCCLDELRLQAWRQHFVRSRQRERLVERHFRLLEGHDAADAELADQFLQPSARVHVSTCFTPAVRSASCVLRSRRSGSAKESMVICTARVPVHRSRLPATAPSRITPAPGV